MSDDLGFLVQEGGFDHSLQANACVSLAEQKIQANELPEAEELLMNAVSLQPSHQGALALLIQLYLDLKHHDHALHYMQLYLTHYPDDAAMQVRCGKVYRSINDTKSALNCFTQAMESDPNFTNSYLELAQLLQYEGKHEKAECILEAALKLFSDNPAILFLLGQTSGKLDKLDQECRYIEQSIATGMDPKLHHMAYHELAKDCDRHTEYGRALHYYEQANRALMKNTNGDAVDKSMAGKLLRGSLGYFASRLHTQWQVFDADAYHAAHAATQPYKDHPAPCFVVGFPKTDNGLLGRLLQSHPQVVALNEPNVFDVLLPEAARLLGGSVGYPQVLSELTDAHIASLRVQYYQFVEQRLGYSIDADTTLVDITPLNIVYLGFIHRLFPEAKVIMQLRDPRQLVLNCFSELIAPGPLTVHMAQPVSTAELYVGFMQLYEVMCEHTEISFKMVKYEDVVENITRYAGEILAFIGKDWHDDVIYACADMDIDDPYPRFNHYTKYLDKAFDIVEPYVKQYRYHDTHDS